MLSIEEIDILCSDEVAAIIDENINNDPIRIALSKKIAHAKLIASQVKYLQRAESKLPSYYSARCVIPSLSFEQSSSEECAGCKGYEGELCLDLTCGLGVDSYLLSKRFERVISIERDPAIAYLAEVNFGRLGVTNIEVVNSSAEEFIAMNIDKLRVDLVYVDPDRRGAKGEKLFLLQHCTPNVLEMLDKLKTISRRIVIKCSPLLDVDEIFNIFRSARVEVISLRGECKEVVVELNRGLDEQVVSAISIGQDRFTVDRRDERRYVDLEDFQSDYNYLIIPDVSLQKARLVKEFYHPQDVYVVSDNGYGLSHAIPERIMGRVVEIEQIVPYVPKVLKRLLKDRGIKNIEVLKKEFDLSSERIAKDLNVKLGGGKQIAFTKINHHLWAIILR